MSTRCNRTLTVANLQVPPSVDDPVVPSGGALYRVEPSTQPRLPLDQFRFDGTPVLEALFDEELPTFPQDGAAAVILVFAL